jgi:hypothetical protein
VQLAALLLYRFRQTRGWSARFVCVIGLAGIIAVAACAANNSASSGNTDMSQLVIRSQSIGRGVPQGTRDALAAIVELLEAEGLQASQQVYGLEGERRVCVELTQQRLEALLPQIESLRSGVELLQVEIQRDSETPCQ